MLSRFINNKRKNKIQATDSQFILPVNKSDIQTGQVSVVATGIQGRESAATQAEQGPDH